MEEIEEVEEERTWREFIPFDRPTRKSLTPEEKEEIYQYLLFLNEVRKRKREEKERNAKENPPAQTD